jgi:hypothetical protein
LRARNSIRHDARDSKARSGVLRRSRCSYVLTDAKSMVMDSSIEIHTLTRFETSDCGDFIKLIGEGAAGQVVSLNFKTSSLSGLLVTLPKLVAGAERRRRNDPSVRLVFELSQLQVELSTDRLTRILTLTTNDGFSISFGLTEVQCRKIARSSDELRSRHTN